MLLGSHLMLKRRNSRIYRKWGKRGKNANDHGNVREIQNSTNKLIHEAKQSYFEKLGHRLSDPKTGQINIWTAFKRITNKKKLTNIPPVIHNNIYRTNFQQKVNVFNNYFADQCKILDNGSALPGFISKRVYLFPKLISLPIRLLGLTKDIILKKPMVVTKYQLQCSNYVMYQRGCITTKFNFS